jgi:dTDP-4-amino-4,6-dideoxygalactose transaminase
MSDIAASIGIHQLKRLPAFQQRRKEIAGAYSLSFAASEALDIPDESTAVTHGWHLYPLRLRLDRLAIDRGQFISEMQNRNIACSVHFMPLHHHSYYKHHTVIARHAPPVMDAEFDRILSIPINPSMSDDDVQDVIAAVKNVVKTFSR